MKNKNETSILFIIFEVLTVFALILLGSLYDPDNGSKIKDLSNSNDIIEEVSLYDDLSANSYIVELDASETDTDTYQILAQNYSGDIPAEDILVQLEYETKESTTLIQVEGTSTGGEKISAWVKKSIYDSIQEKISDGTVEELPPQALYYLLNENGDTICDESGGPITAKLTEIKAVFGNKTVDVEMVVPYNYSTTLADLLAGNFNHTFEKTDDIQQNLAISLWMNDEQINADELGINFELIVK